MGPPPQPSSTRPRSFGSSSKLAAAAAEFDPASVVRMNVPPAIPADFLKVLSEVSGSEEREPPFDTIDALTADLLYDVGYEPELQLVLLLPRAPLPPPAARCAWCLALGARRAWCAGCPLRAG